MSVAGGKADNEKPQQKGEELDLDRLIPWMHQYWPELETEPTVTQFSGGASNWTYRLQFKDLDLILRRAPLGKKASGAHDMPREFHLQKQLRNHFPYVPNMIAVCEDEGVLGSTFYLMERLEGLIPRKNLPRQYYGSPEVVNDLCRSFWDKLIELHRVDYLKNNLDNLGKGKGYIERQITGWNKRFSDARTWNVRSGKKVMAWLEANLPSKEHLCLIHNDFRLDNVVIHQENLSKIIGVLDWELASIGDPLMDLGNSMAYWIQADDDAFGKSIRRQPSNAPGMFTRAEILKYYSDQTGFEFEDFRFYRVYGLFRLAGIAQQIYFRYSKGFTKNRAFKNFWLFSNYLIFTCENVIKQKR